MNYHKNDYQINNLLLKCPFAIKNICTRSQLEQCIHMQSQTSKKNQKCSVHLSKLNFLFLPLYIYNLSFCTPNYLLLIVERKNSTTDHLLINYQSNTRPEPNRGSV